MVGKELHTSEVPTLCAVIQKGIWERVLVELGKAKTESIQKIYLPNYDFHLRKTPAAHGCQKLGGGGKADSQAYQTEKIGMRDIHWV